MKTLSDAKYLMESGLSLLLGGIESGGAIF
jgi:hypothetical protein